MSKSQWTVGNIMQIQIKQIDLYFPCVDDNETPCFVDDANASSDQDLAKAPRNSITHMEMGTAWKWEQLMVSEQHSNKLATKPPCTTRGDQTYASRT